MKASGPTAMILGPHPGNGMYSIANYFSFLSRNLAGALPEYSIRAACPGDVAKFDLPVLKESSRLSSWWENYGRWPLRLRTLRADLFHVVDQGLAWYGKQLKGGRRIVTVHDLISHLDSAGTGKREPLSPLGALLLRLAVDEIRHADCVVSISRNTADCLIRDLGLPASKIVIVHNFVSKAFWPPTPAERIAARKKWFGDAQHVVIHVGKPFGYKNRLGALRAFTLLRKSMTGAAMYLFSDPATAEEKALIGECGFPEAFHFLSGVPVEGLREAFGSADALIFPSRYEGFGLPPLEAMACGCPVVSTTCGSLAEIVGDAALTVGDPDDHQGLANRLQAILSDPLLAGGLRRKGFEQAAKFQPEASLRKMAEVYRGVLR